MKVYPAFWGYDSDDRRFKVDNGNRNEQEPKIEEKRMMTSRFGKEVQNHLWVFLVVAFGILLYVALDNLELIKNSILWLVKILSPLLIGSLLALVLNSPMMAIVQFLNWMFVQLFGRKKKDYKPNARGIEIAALALTVLLAVLIIYIIVYSVVPQLIESIKAIFLQLPGLVPKIMSLLDRIDDYGLNTESFRETLSNLDFNEIVKKVTDIGLFTPDTAGSLVNSLFSSASTLVNGAFTAVTSIIFALYVLSNKKSLSCQLKKVSYSYLKKERVDRAIELGKITTETFSSFISGQCLDAVILGLMCLFAMAVFGFPYALAVSSMITITAIIPYVGAFLGGAFGVMLMIINSPLQALLFVVLFIVVQQIDNHIVYPRVVGGSVGLPAVWTFIAVILGGALFGVIGMVIFIPIFSVIYTLIRKNVNKRLAERGITVEYHGYEEREKKTGKFWEAVSSAIDKLRERISAQVSKKNNNRK